MPTDGLRFQHRWHFSPSAFLTLIERPSISALFKASSTGSSLFRVTCDTIRSVGRKGSYCFRSSAYSPSACRTTFASREFPINFSARLSSRALRASSLMAMSFSHLASSSLSIRVSSANGKSARKTLSTGFSFIVCHISSAVNERTGAISFVIDISTSLRTYCAALRSGESALKV